MQPAKRAKKSQTIPASDWLPHKARIVELHINQDLPLRQVQAIMEKEGFVANERQYRTRISQWGLDKNVKSHQMRAIVRKQQQRQLHEPLKKPLTFVINGKRIREDQVSRWRNRHEDSAPTSPAAPTPSELNSRTISDSGSPAPAPSGTAIPILPQQGRVASLDTTTAPLSMQTSIKQGVMVSTLDTDNYLALMYAKQVELAGVEQTYRQALLKKVYALESEHIYTLETVHNMGHLYADQGRLAEAERMYERALSGKEEALGAHHASTLNTVHELGIIYMALDKFFEAEQTFKRALTGRKSVLGLEHPSTLDTTHALGCLYHRQDKITEAERMFEQALIGRQKVLGPTDTATLTTVNNLGCLYGEQGKFAEAKEMYERALAGIEHSLGPTHPATQQIARNLESLQSMWDHFANNQGE